jgi:hypothetical protein
VHGLKSTDLRESGYAIDQPSHDHYAAFNFYEIVNLKNQA